MVLIENLFSFLKKYKFLIIFTVVICAGYILNRQLKKLNLENDQKETALIVTTDLESKRAQIITFALKRSLAQQKVLSNYKMLNNPLKKYFSESDKIQFLNQKDFNDYEYYQNHIQNLLAKKIAQELNPKNKQGTKAHLQDIKNLEWSEKSFNEARIKFSEKEIEFANLKNRTPITFLSDVQLLESQLNQ